eukprot:1154930-Pelagomonas_calceolata.AAC.2
MCINCHHQAVSLCFKKISKDKSNAGKGKEKWALDMEVPDDFQRNILSWACPTSQTTFTQEQT